MQRNLSLSVLAVAVLSGCATDLRPITKPAGNPRVVERTLAAPKPAPARAAVRPVADAGKAVDPFADLPVMPSKGASPAVARPALASGAVPAPPPAAGAAAAKDGGKASTEPAKKPVREVVWTVKATDLHLAATFERWAKESKELGKPYTVLWDADRHVLIDAGTEYRGTFTQAVEQALRSPSISKSNYPLEFCEYSNLPPVVRITRWGEQTQECPEFR